MAPSREATPPSEAASCSFAALATSTAFVQALQRDVHILLDAFALTWLWLDQNVDAPSSLRWEYGAMAVFQRVWARNQWPQVSGLLGSEVRTRRAFMQAVADAFLDRIAAATGAATTEPHTVLHAVGALLGLYCWWHAQPTGAWPAIRVDPAAYTAIASLPERARAVLDAGPEASTLPPSADVWYVAQQMLGTATAPGYIHLYMAPRHVPRLRALTTVMPRQQLEARPRLVGSIGTTQAPRQAPPAEAPLLHGDVQQDVGLPSEGPAPAASTRTTQSLEALWQAQREYARAQKSVEDAVAWDSSSWDEGRPLSLPTILAYLQSGTGPAS
ncbi:unnamed protein product [Malassezia sympodialis ATCC 42132]|uniref:Uncharacterized protein n=1 Tax=Malassezia sympodialis (strain ATCC 42132) TaxID=1230383 RepID=M5EBY5_MALS4|nr:uncharacterized protein MSY001_3129 [Malassezia sympodialis ATCC 42132]CCV00424.1 unnamed protein product [Malassezia sympodialis ATCC 42132]SHO79866.1 Uncharacterized protein MSYG_4218 [Malassezia sympodialis ATCC 42132]|eukprot:XP_018741622.1 uncharacterized protein MSY001_3129 [Malassezia sympodialis ATCC 42132]